MRSSIRFLICLGSGLKWRISWVDASSTSFWWSSVFRVFMMRTIAACGGVGEEEEAGA